VFDVVMKAEAYVNKYLHAPFVMVGSVIVEAMKDVASVIAKVLEGIKTAALGTLQIVAEIGGPGSKWAGRMVDRLHGWDVSEAAVRRSLDSAAKGLERLAVNIDQHADEWIQREIGATGEKWAQAIREGIGAGRGRNFLEDLERAVGDMIDNMMKGIVVAPDAPAAGAPLAGRAAEALVGGSREAVRAIVQADAALRGGPKAPEERAAAGIDKLVGRAGEQLAEMQGLREDFRQRPPVELGVV
jgi:hypothetical protein